MKKEERITSEDVENIHFLKEKVEGLSSFEREIVKDRWAALQEFGQSTRVTPKQRDVLSETARRIKVETTMSRLKIKRQTNEIK